MAIGEGSAYPPVTPCLRTSSGCEGGALGGPSDQPAEGAAKVPGVVPLKRRDERAGEVGVPDARPAEGRDGEPDGVVGAPLDHERLLTTFGMPLPGAVAEADAVLV